MNDNMLAKARLWGFVLGKCCCAEVFPFWDYWVWRSVFSMNEMCPRIPYGEYWVWSSVFSMNIHRILQRSWLGWEMTINVDNKRHSLGWESYITTAMKRIPQDLEDSHQAEPTFANSIPCRCNGLKGTDHQISNDTGLKELDQLPFYLWWLPNHLIS